jgi:hypothetical protein
MERYQQGGARLHRMTPLNAAALGELEFVCIAATDRLADDGYALDMAGADLSWFGSGNATLLYMHDPTAVVGRIVSASASGSNLRARCTFAPAGISDLADEVRGLVKSGVLNAVSIGFSVEAASPMAGGRLATAWTPYELSCCSTPMDFGALITARSHTRSRAGAAHPQFDVRSLPSREQAALYAYNYGRGVQEAAAERAWERRDYERRQREKKLLLGSF